MSNPIEQASDAIISSSITMHELIKSEVYLDKNQQILLKTRKRLKKEHRLLIIPTAECKYDIIDLRTLETKLQELMDLKKKKLISEEDYEILKSKTLRKFNKSS
ncbi:hypothetical protein K0U27_00805 [archaeon]|nr:hypothetical protein [archaeon]